MLSRRSNAPGVPIATSMSPGFITALRRADGHLETQPAPSAVINPGDMLVAIGTPGELERLESTFEPQTVSAS